MGVQQDWRPAPMSHLSMCLQQAISASSMFCGFARHAEAGAATSAIKSIAAMSALMRAASLQRLHQQRAPAQAVALACASTTFGPAGQSITSIPPRTLLIRAFAAGVYDMRVRVNLMSS